MRVFEVVVGPFEMNSYIIAEDNHPECIIIDPGDEPDEIIKTIDENKLKPVKIINTHNHIDHARRVSIVQKHYDIPFLICEDDLPLLESIQDQGVIFGLDASEVPEVSSFLKDGDRFKLVDEDFLILQTPGHSPGSISIYTEGHVFVGDVLFRDSIGRTDLYGGNYETLMKSIREKLMTLPDNTKVYSGHGPTTTIGREREFNPFINPTKSPY
ncbi:MAG: MBL fold metallo-hydrolase [Calditrichaceae bacterium]